jgi:hypothetical protein
MPLELVENGSPAGVPTVVVRGGADPPLRTSSAPDAVRIIARHEKRRIKACLTQRPGNRIFHYTCPRLCY